MNRLNYLQAMQNQDNPENDLGKALYRVAQLEAEVARLNKAVEQAIRLGRIGFYECYKGGEWVEDENLLENSAVSTPVAIADFPELSKWLQENK